jgi:hypothetical protein
VLGTTADVAEWSTIIWMIQKFIGGKLHLYNRRFDFRIRFVRVAIKMVLLRFRLPERSAASANVEFGR